MQRDKVSPAIPSWLLSDHRHETHFMNSVLIMPGAKKKLIEKGGLVTDENARVLREDGSVIDGLYATGNNMAAVMGAHLCWRREYYRASSGVRLLRCTSRGAA